MNEIISYLDNEIIDKYRDRLLHIKNNYNVIKQEADLIGSELYMPFNDSNKDNNYWNVYFLKKINRKMDNLDVAKRTTEIVCADHSIVNAFFSFMKPNSKINSHKDTLHVLYRSHLGINVPNDYKFICNESDITTKNGEINIFDLTDFHEAHNDSSSHRIVLILDILKPYHYFLI